MFHGPVNYDEDRLKSLLLNPIDRPKIGNMWSSYLDPDSNFEFRLPCSNYIVEEELNTVANNADVFSIMLIKARSLLKNLQTPLPLSVSPKLG